MLRLEDLHKRVVEKLKKIKLLACDVDGVLTDGRILLDESGVETRLFDVKDGSGIYVLRRLGYEVVFISGRESRVVSRRGEKLGVSAVCQGVVNKSEKLTELLAQFELSSQQVCYIGDDVIDIGVMQSVGLAVAVADAVDEVKQLADLVTTRNGGRGAVREIAELIVKAQGKWSEVLQWFK